ncbi:MAG: NUDIX domain-containing protein [Patescibacteria group bacterium]
MEFPCDECGQYKTPSLTIDGIVLHEGKILLIKRGVKDEAFYNEYALPGGFVEYGEETEKATIREVWEETGLKTEINQLVGVYSKPNRDPRRHVISIAYSLKVISGDIKESSETKDISWFDLDNLPKLAFDHQRIITDFRESNKMFSDYNGWQLDKKLVFCSHSRHFMHASLLICKYVIDQGGVPINSFTNFGYFLYELVSRHDIAEGINNIINRCDEQWVFGPIGGGVGMEIEMCKKMGKKIRFFDIEENDNPMMITETTEEALRNKYP